MRVSCGCATRDLASEQIKASVARCEILKLVCTYFSIEKPVVRERIPELMKSIATTPTEE